MSINAGVGLAQFPFSGGAAFWRWVALCESGGVDSIWQNDRMVSREPVLECMSVMAGLAAATTRLKFGMNVASVGLRDPLLLAKQCATIDVLSGGRLLPAFGVGSPRAPEWQVIGRSSKGAGAMAEEGMEIISRLWSEETVSFHGKYFQFENAFISPRPLQHPMPLWIGGSSQAAIRRTARLATGWQAGGETPQEVRPVVARIKELALEYGRRFDPDHFGAGIPFRFGSWNDESVRRQCDAYQKRTGRDPQLAFAVGDGATILARVRDYVDAGIAKFIMRPLADGDAEMFDQTQRLIGEVLPGVKAMNAERKARLSS